MSTITGYYIEPDPLDTLALTQCKTYIVGASCLYEIPSHLMHVAEPPLFRLGLNPPLCIFLCELCFMLRKYLWKAKEAKAL